MLNSGRVIATAIKAWLWFSLLRSEDVEGSLEIVCSGGEVDLEGGFGETAPSHSAQAVIALPGTEDLFDPVPGIEAGKRLALAAERAPLWWADPCRGARQPSGAGASCRGICAPARAPVRHPPRRERE